jgi:hypothetical protein
VSETPDKASGGFSSGDFSDAFAKPIPPSSGVEQGNESKKPAPAGNGDGTAKPNTSPLKRQIFKALFLAFTAASVAMSPAHAQNTKAQLNTQINTTFPDQTIGQITPLGMRTFIWVRKFDYADCASGIRQSRVFQRDYGVAAGLRISARSYHPQYRRRYRHKPRCRANRSYPFDHQQDRGIKLYCFIHFGRWAGDRQPS